MDSKYTIKNFRVFDSEGVAFELAPITILTGCNSSGKSSLVKSLMVLGDYFKRVREDYKEERTCHLQDYKLDFSKRELDLGNFKEALNSKAPKDSKITFAYTVHSLVVTEDVTVEMSFKTDENDEMNNGWLSDITISLPDGEILYSAIVNKKKELEVKTANLNYIRERFIDFSICDYYYSVVGDSDNCINEEELEHYCNDIGKREFSSYELDIIKPTLEFYCDGIEKMKFSTQILNSCRKWHLQTKYYSDEKGITLNWDRTKWNLIKQVYENKTIYCMPIFDILKDIPKKSVRDVFEKLIDEKEIKDDRILRNIYMIIDGFEQSKFDHFIDYFISLEEEPFLRKTERGKNFIADFVQSTNPIFINDGDKIGLWVPDLPIDIKEGIEKNKKSNFFYMMYNTLMVFCCKIDDSFNKDVHGMNDYAEWIDNPPTYYLFKDYLSALLEELIIKATKEMTGTKYVGTTTTSVKRLYTSDLNSGFNNLLEDYFETKRLYIQRKKEEEPVLTQLDPEGNPITEWPEDCVQMYKYEPDNFLNYWIKEFNIGDKIEIKSAEMGLGIIIHIYKNGKKYLLAEEGYGITQLLSFLLQIETSIMKAHRYKALMDIPYTWPGDPLVCDASIKELQYEPSTISVEEPETHLHPAFQSLLADVLKDAYKNYNINFIVETHSEYLIRKLQTLVAKKELQQEEVSIYYINNPDKEKRPEGVEQAYKIEIKEDGRLNNPFGSGFFDEADNLSMELLTLKSKN